MHFQDEVNFDRPNRIKKKKKKPKMAAAGITMHYMQQFIAGLKSRSEEVRLKAARDLHHYVTRDWYRCQRVVRNAVCFVM